MARLLCWPLAIAIAVASLSVARADNEHGRAPVRDPDRIFFEYIWSYQELQRRNIVMQKQDFSCGAAVLATVVRYYWGDPATEADFLALLPKLKLTPAELKDRVENGLTLTDLRDLANKVGYEASMGKVQFSELRQSKVPVIVGITVNGHDHFVVYRGTDGEYAYLADPIRGNVRTKVPEFLKQWQKNGILVVAKPNTMVKAINPLGVRMSEANRGALNMQTVRRNYLSFPDPSGVH
ncbi:MAG TPA: cysteine peptidase family C39 domain-containing protein [Pirellulales bacterium]|nr:cysteine peptidase family C39 domain-containing protein [Pirellulales bacterium]